MPSSEHEPGGGFLFCLFRNDKITTTGLAGLLKARGCLDLTFVGLATDYCVAWSAATSRAGVRCHVALTACAIDLDGSLDTALDDMHAAGIRRHPMMFDARFACATPCAGAEVRIFASEACILSSIWLKKGQ